MTDFRETLATIDKSGKRHWVYSHLVAGNYFKLRSAVAAILIAVYLLMPWIDIGGSQAIALNLVDREFVFFGHTFFATETKFLALILAALGLSLFFFTALLGRVWCGWACPETIFLEFVFRPIERLIEGSPAQRKRLDEAPWGADKFVRKGLKYSVYLILAWVMASTLLAYFIGRERLLTMMSYSPTENITPFLLTLVVMAVVLFQFGWFREQFCTVLCPYARFQSVLLDPHSLLVGYDRSRGEPRGKGKRNEGDSRGDCVDCGVCVRVCPTGIDIRNGLQLECVQCAACADGCDSVMVQIGKPKGLIRYATERSLEGQRTAILRPRILAYGVALLTTIITFTVLLSTRALSEFDIIRSTADEPFTVLPDGRISNHLLVHITNKDSIRHSYTATVIDRPDITLVAPQPFPVNAKNLGQLPIFLTFPRDALKQRHVVISLSNAEATLPAKTITLLGPEAPKGGD